MVVGSGKGGGMVRTTLFAALLAVLLFACDRGERPPAQENPAPGVTDTTIRLGSSLALTGHAGYLGTQTLRGALCYLNHVNEQGGVFGRRIELISYDDSYDPPRCLANTQKLLVEDQVFALFCYVGTPTTVKILPMVEDAGAPLVGMFTGANALRQPFNRYLVNIRASYYQETAAAVRHLVGDLGLRRIAVFYQYDAYGFDGLTGTELALKEYGLEPVARGSYVRGTQDVDEGFSRIESSAAQAVVMIGTSDPCARFIELGRLSGLSPIYYAVSFVGAEALAKALGPKPGALVIMSQVVPPTLRPSGQAGATAERQPAGRDGDSARQYVELLARYFPGDQPDPVGLEGFYNARVLVEALRRAGRDLTRASFIKAIESIDNLELEPGLMAKFGPENHQGLGQVYFTHLVNGRFEELSSWAEVPAEAARVAGGAP
jgi:ABC-type branched-subunit amino acid transport system substrate-binding protein